MSTTLRLPRTAPRPGRSGATPYDHAAATSHQVDEAAPFGTTFAFELRKVLAPQRVRAFLLAVAVLPALFIGAIGLQDQRPVDTIFGRWMTSSGWASVFTIVAFACLWVLPLVTSVVAGDSFASEDRLGTWRHLVMAVRSPRRIFAAKVLAAYLVVELFFLVMLASAVLGGLVFVGNHPLVGLAGQQVPGGSVLGSLVLVWLTVSVGTLAFAALGVLGSVLLGRSPMGLLLPAVVALGLQLAQLLPLPVAVRLALPSQSFLAWRGLLAEPSHTRAWLAGLAVSLVWTVVTTLLARHLFLRRDFTDLAYDGAPRRTVLAGLLPLLLLVGVLSVLLWPVAHGEAGQGITRPKVEQTTARTFANLLRLQYQQMGRPVPSVEQVAATAACDRGGDRVEDIGPGTDWRCVVTYHLPGTSAEGQAIYQMDVVPDGRIVADGDGPIPVNGYFLVEGPTGPAANPLWQFDALVDLLPAR